jgi:hypothetical protein
MWRNLGRTSAIEWEIKGVSRLRPIEFMEGLGG